MLKMYLVKLCVAQRIVSHSAKEKRRRIMNKEQGRKNDEGLGIRGRVLYL